MSESNGDKNSLKTESMHIIYSNDVLLLIELVSHSLSQKGFISCIIISGRLVTPE